MSWTVASEVLTDVKQLTPEWLSERLRANGHVVSVTERNSFDTPSSRMWFVDVEYSADTPLSAPRGMFFKVSSPGRERVNDSEVDFPLLASKLCRTVVCPRNPAATRFQHASAIAAVVISVGET